MCYRVKLFPFVKLKQTGEKKMREILNLDKVSLESETHGTMF